MVTATKPNNRMAKDTPPAVKAAKKAKEPASPFDANPDLKNTLAQIEKQFGEGAIMPLGAATAVQIDGIPTGSLSLDMALGGQGIPRGRIVEVFGPESSGKTTLALHVVAQAQRAGGIAAFIDAEHALDPSWAKKLGVELETLLVSQPGSGEEAMHITEMLIKSNAVDVIVIDSVAALVPKKELDGEIGDSHVGLQARLMSQSMRKLTGAISKSKTSVIFINQIREKIGVMFGSPETTPGGRALKFYSSCRIDVRRIGQLKEGEEVVGQRVRAKVVKNKVAPPFRVAEFDMMHADGISYEGDVLDLAIAQKLIVRTGAWFRYGDLQLGQGREKVRDYLKENPAVTEELKEKILSAGGSALQPPRGRSRRRVGQATGQFRGATEPAVSLGRAGVSDEACPPWKCPMTRVPDSLALVPCLRPAAAVSLIGRPPGRPEASPGPRRPRASRPPPRIEDVLVKAIARAEPSVVAIARVVSPRARSPRRFRPDPFDRLVGRSSPKPRPIPTSSPTSTPPAWWSTRGLILTAYHVLGEDSEETTTGSPRPSQGLSGEAGRRPTPAAIWPCWQSTPHDLMPITFGDATKLKKGQIVIALGNPYAIARDGQPSASWGIVSNLARKAPPTPGMRDTARAEGRRCTTSAP